ncbi:PTS sugar transporter subunit IIC [Erysipelothrix inopinata]|uniref:PTS sugar transporter subunit IIC n=1 Tax=Erysipelothrix inopinata TaxID=225084 RepID=A0A7G9RW91_9FIRM|nr:PTS sugar transporter subunit IIC [Erysipelothrix inopinata]QNN59866.1 PTS sugar transporter subunit IIC [Erysipelothrix inopinata]
MSLITALLLASWAGFCSYDDQGPQLFRRPLLVGPVVGIILGDLNTALIVSATLELMWMGLGNMAGYQTPDMIVGTIVGVTFAITTGQGIAVGIATASTVSLLCQQLILLLNVVKSMFFNTWADRLAKTGNFNSLIQINIAAIVLFFLFRAIPVFLIIYFGNGIVDQLLLKVPTDVLNALNTASAILPAIGLSILMTIIMKKGMWAFLFLGFILNANLELSILGVTLISLSIATLYMWFMELRDRMDEQKMVVVSEGNQEVQEEYDL